MVVLHHQFGNLRAGVCWLGGGISLLALLAWAGTLRYMAVPAGR